MYYIILIQFKLLSFAEVNAKDIISEGALWELVRISRECSREDIRTLAYRTLTSSPTLEAEMNRLGIKLL
jgi:kinesin family member 5